MILSLSFNWISRRELTKLTRKRKYVSFNVPRIGSYNCFQQSAKFSVSFYCFCFHLFTDQGMLYDDLRLLKHAAMEEICLKFCKFQDFIDQAAIFVSVKI